MIAIDLGKPRGEVPAADVEVLVRSWLDTEPNLSEEEKQIIARAVLNHGRPNEESDDAVTIALKDADRVVNTRLDVIIRSAQFHSEQLVLDPVRLLSGEKVGRYNSRPTVMDALRDCLDWGDFNSPENARFAVRTEKAKWMITEYVAELRAFLEKIVEQRRKEGLVPYPVEFARD